MFDFFHNIWYNEKNIKGRKNTTGRKCEQIELLLRQAKLHYSQDNFTYAANLVERPTVCEALNAGSPFVSKKVKNSEKFAIDKLIIIMYIML